MCGAVWYKTEGNYETHDCSDRGILIANHKTTEITSGSTKCSTSLAEAAVAAKRGIVQMVRNQMDK